MRAALIRAFGPPEVLSVEQVDMPAPGAGEVLVRVAAVEVSRIRDVATRSGNHPFSRLVTLPHVLGGDFAGVVESVGADVDPSWIGRRVAAMNTSTCGHCVACRSGREYECAELRMIGIHSWGSYAEFAVAPARSLHLLPDDLGLIEAAALAATGPIALTQLQTVGAIAGGTVLITGITGSLATMLAALAPRFGADVLGLSRRPDSTPPSLALRVLSVDRTDLTEAIKGATAGGPVGVIDNVGTPEVFDRYFPALRNGARIVVSGAIGDGELPTLRVPVAPFYLRSLSIVGVRTATQQTTREFWELVRAGFRLPGGLLHEVPLAAAASAHGTVIAGTTTGHTVLAVEGAPR